MTKNYNATLAKDYEDIKRRVSTGMLPLVARVPAIDKAVSEYALAQADRYEMAQAKAEEEGRSPNTVPINYRDSSALERFADLMLYEELRWSHPDKMTIVDYPIMSARNERSYEEKHTPKSELKYGDLRYLGKRKTGVDDDDLTAVHKRRIVDSADAILNHSELSIDVQDALNNAGLTDRQRQAIGLVFFENMTQEQAGAELGVTQQAIDRYLRFALEKLRKVVVKR